MESCCKPSTTSRIVGERSQGHGSETTNGVSVARWTCHLVFFHPRNQNVVFFECVQPTLLFFQRDLNLNDFQQQFSTNQPTLPATGTTPGKKPLLQRDADLFGVLPRGPWVVPWAAETGGWPCENLLGWHGIVTQAACPSVTRIIDILFSRESV